MSLRLKYVAGLYEIGDMFLYVNQGTGTLGPKMRLGTANEITLITLEPTR
jgi:predicted MPP superfamily phosphohydrolase